MVTPTSVRDQDRPANTHRIANWDPEDAAAWNAGNNVIARRNLIWSIASAHTAFSIWYLWSVMVLFMPQAVYGFTSSDKLLVSATAALVGAIVRVPYTVATTRFGARNWATSSSLVLLIPTGGTIVLLANPGLPLWPYLLCAALTGLGGGNYAAALTNAEELYPQRRKGLALGLTGGIANLGAASIQAVGLVVLATVGHREPYWVCAIYLVLLAVVGLGAALYMDNFAQPIRVTDLRCVLATPDTWGILLLYMIVSGSFLGFAFAFGQVIHLNLVASGQSHAQASLHAAEVAFVGPLLGSVARIVGGGLSDRFGGGRVTLGALASMIVAGGFLVGVSSHEDLTHGPGGPATALTMVGYIVGFIALFIFCGIGKGSVSKLIPSVFEARSRALDVSKDERRHWECAASGSVLGLAGALGALGAMGTNLALRQSYLSAHTETPAFTSFLVCYIAAAILTWVRYARARSAGAPTRDDLPASTDTLIGEPAMTEVDTAAATIEVSDASLASTVLSSNKPVLLEFRATWCPRCQMAAPILEALATELAGRLTIAKLDVDANPETTRDFHVTSIPTLILFKDGQPVRRIVGAKARTAYLRELSEAIPDLG